MQSERKGLFWTRSRRKRHEIEMHENNSIRQMGHSTCEAEPGGLLKTSISRDMGSATKAALILNRSDRSVVQFRILGRPTDLSKYFLVIRL